MEIDVITVGRTEECHPNNITDGSVGLGADTAREREIYNGRLF
jgi:hypothetical protein